MKKGGFLLLLLVVLLVALPVAAGAVSASKGALAPTLQATKIAAPQVAADEIAGVGVTACAVDISTTEQPTIDNYLVAESGSGTLRVYRITVAMIGEGCANSPRGT